MTIFNIPFTFKKVVFYSFFGEIVSFYPHIQSLVVAQNLAESLKRYSSPLQ